MHIYAKYFIGLTMQGRQPAFARLVLVYIHVVSYRVHAVRIEEVEVYAWHLELGAPSLHRLNLILDHYLDLASKKLYKLRYLLPVKNASMKSNTNDNKIFWPWALNFFI